MRVSHRRSRDEVADRRQQRYLTQWPVSRQMEALQDAANGRPEKLDRMNADFAAIKAGLPYPEIKP